MRIRYTFFFIVFFAIYLNNLNAKHIVGGVMSYTCLGNNKYKIKLKVYRDCLGGGAGFDSPAEIGVYKCGNSINCSSLTQFSVLQTPNPTPGPSNEISAPTYPCLKVPPSVCVEESNYEFTVTLPKSSDSYYVVYQRCCRNVTLSNIYDPENTGATFMIEITPAAQQNCNSSPEFSFFPPTIICANATLDFDHSAIDPDGDQLVYELCSPLIGGGPTGGPNEPGSSSGCSGILPNPACPPPYNSVQFILPNYSFDKPLGQNSPIAIDPFTGKMTVLPGVIGQFVVGVCVSEYRNGVLLSTVRRDFQFNVANCEPNVAAEIKNDKVIGKKQFLVNSCGQKTIKFINQSHPIANIFKYDWHFPDGTPQDVNTADALITFPDTGTYQGVMIINEGSICADTASIFVTIYPDLNADFEYDYDTCVAEPVQFKDLSTSEAGNVQKWVWNFKDKSFSSFQNPMHSFKEPGNYPVRLTITDLNGCRDSIEKNIRYFPVPPLIVINPSNFLGCAPASIKFTNLSTPIDNTYDVIWTFGDGESTNEISPTHIYSEAGTYSVTIDITSPIGCKTSDSYTDYIQVEPSPVADFIYSPDDPSNINPVIEFTDKSEGAVSWGWEFGDSERSFLQNPIHTFKDTGLFVITQLVKHKSGCTDTLTKIIDIRPLINYFLPNAFTPNGDGLNDEFKGAGIFLGMEDFEMNIWDRWGEKIFTTNDPLKGWDGRVNNQGNFVQSGVYVCTVKYKAPRNKYYEIVGYATIVR